MNTREDGYRYCRQYRTPKGHVRWALWECKDGVYHRVGTAPVYDGDLDFYLITARAFIEGRIGVSK